MSSDRPVDLEKGATEVKAAATKEVNPRMTMCHMVFVDVVAVLHVLFCIGVITLIVSKYNWLATLPAFAFLLPLTVFTLWIKPKTKYAMEPTPGSDNDISNKLLAEK